MIPSLRNSSRTRRVSKHSQPFYIRDTGELTERAVTEIYKDWFKSYHAETYHSRFLIRLRNAHQRHSGIFAAGSSSETRSIQGIHMWGKSGPGVNPAIVFHGTAHAREWISTMVTEYIAYQLLTRYGKDHGISDALDNYDFYILPIVNPDGMYSYLVTSPIPN